MKCPHDDTEMESVEIEGGRVFYYCLYENDDYQCSYSETR